MQRQKINGRMYNSLINYDTRIITNIKADVISKVQAYNNRKSSKEQTLNDLQLILNKVNLKLGSFTTN